MSSTVDTVIVAASPDKVSEQRLRSWARTERFNGHGGLITCERRIEIQADILPFPRQSALVVVRIVLTLLVLSAQIVTIWRSGKPLGKPLLTIY